MNDSRVISITLALALAALSGCLKSTDGDSMHKVNGSVHVAAGNPPANAKTVNGGIEIESNAVVTTATTVNGSVHMNSHSSAQSLETVNGAIILDAGARVAGTAETVNGSLTLDDGAEVAGALINVNGKIELTSAHVAGGIKTVGGNIDIFGSSRVEGGILVQKQSGIIHIGSDVPRIVIGPGVTVQGALKFEREVRLYVSDHATIGAVIGTTPMPFSGEKPTA